MSPNHLLQVTTLQLIATILIFNRFILPVSKLGRNGMIFIHPFMSVFSYSIVYLRESSGLLHIIIICPVPLPYSILLYLSTIIDGSVPLVVVI